MKKIIGGILVVVIAVVVILLVFNNDLKKNSPIGDTNIREVKVAVLLPQTGPQAGIGRGCANSVKLAFDQAKPTLKEAGVSVELVMLDDGSKPETAVSAAQRVTANSEIRLAIAHFNSPCALATVDIFHEGRTPMIVPAAINSGVTAKGYPEIFRTCNTDIQQAIFMAKFLTDILKADKIYAIDDRSAFGKGLIGALKQELTNMDKEFYGQDAFKVGDVDFSAVLARSEAVNPDVIVLGCLAAEGALFRRQMVNRSMSIPVVGFSGIFYETFLVNAGEAAEGTRAIFPIAPLEELPGGSEYIKAYEDAGFSEPYESAGPFGYVAGQIAVEALRHGPLTRDGLVETLRNKDFTTAFGQLKFEENGEMNLKMFCFYEVLDGKWTVSHMVKPTGKIVAAGE